MSVTQTTTAGVDRYDRKTILLHWLTALLVLLAWGIAQIIDDFPRGPLRVDARSLHITVGVALAVVLVARLVNRAGPGRSLPGAGSRPMQWVAKATHFGLYALVIAQVLLGLVFAYSRGDSLFNLVALPGLANKDLRHTVGDLHGTIATAILILAGLHAAAALAHQFFWRDNVLRRMLPEGWLPSPLPSTVKRNEV